MARKIVCEFQWPEKIVCEFQWPKKSFENSSGLKNRFVNPSGLKIVLIGYWAKIMPRKSFHEVLQKKGTMVAKKPKILENPLITEDRGQKNAILCSFFLSLEVGATQQLIRARTRSTKTTNNYKSICN